MTSFYDEYVNALDLVLNLGDVVSPRGLRIKEITGLQLTVPDALNTLLVDGVRDLNYRFMLAEWLWIAAGDNRVETLLRYNKNYREFSDDGQVLAGAYGPRLAIQWGYLYETLRRDPDSRQAVASIWTPSPAPSKDIPCTLTAQFLIRGGKLNSIWTMRSSDLWLGLPYDVFTFSMLQNALAGALEVPIGSLTMQLGSAHLYEKHWELARKMHALSGHVARDRSKNRAETSVVKLPGGKAVRPGSYDNQMLPGILHPSTATGILEGPAVYHVDESDAPAYGFYLHALHQTSKLACLEALLGL